MIFVGLWHYMRRLREILRLWYHRKTNITQRDYLTDRFKSFVLYISKEVVPTLHTRGLKDLKLFNSFCETLLDNNRRDYRTQ